MQTSSDSDLVALSSQKLPPAPQPLDPAASPGNFLRLDLPFQAHVVDLKGIEHKSHSVPVQSLTAVRDKIKLYRDAVLTSCEAVVYPSAPSLKIPVTVDLVFTTADITVTGVDVLATPSSTRITVGGLSILRNGVLPADLKYINPIIKSPIPYTNHPRLNLLYHANPDATPAGESGSVKASIFIRGTIRVSNPLITNQ